MRTVFFPLILEHWWVFSHSFDCNSKVFGLRDARLGGTGSDFSPLPGGIGLRFSVPRRLIISHLDKGAKLPRQRAAR